MSKLVDDPSLGHGDASGGNLLVHGDNLAALGALVPTLRGAVRLVYLDPPYNTGSAFEHYDDQRDHDAWLAMMRATLEALVPLLRDDAVVVAQTDRTESAYLKVLMDAVLGRAGYVTTVAVRMSGTSGYKIHHTASTVVKNTEYLHVYAPRRFVLEGRAYAVAAYDDHYNLCVHTDADGAMRVAPLVDDPDVRAYFTQERLAPLTANLAALYRTEPFRQWVALHGARVVRAHTAPRPAQRAHAEARLFAPGDPPDRVIAQEYRGERYLLRRGVSNVEQLIPLALKLQPVDTGVFPETPVLTTILGDWWDGFHLDMGNVEREGAVAFKNGKKPERLLRRLLTLFTRPGDTVLDPFAGSGTTAAVAHKMRRRWVALESGAQCRSHIVPRLGRVVDGRDPTGVTAVTGWTGGGGWRGMRLADG